MQETHRLYLLQLDQISKLQQQCCSSLCSQRRRLAHLGQRLNKWVTDTRTLKRSRRCGETQVSSNQMQRRVAGGAGDGEGDQGENQDADQRSFRNGDVPAQEKWVTVTFALHRHTCRSSLSGHWW